MSDHQAINLFLTSIKNQSESVRTDLFEIEAIETGGTIITPNPYAKWAHSHAYEITLHGLYMTGASMREAMIKWERTALRHLAHAQQYAAS